MVIRKSVGHTPDALHTHDNVFAAPFPRLVGAIFTITYEMLSR